MAAGEEGGNAGWAVVWTGHLMALKPTTMNTCRQTPVPTTIRLNPAVEARLDRLASRTGRTKAFYLRRLIEEHLDDLEDAYLGESAWEAFQTSGEATIPYDTLKQELALAD